MTGANKTDQDSSRSSGLIFGRGMMAKFIGSHNWNSTPVGSLETWPADLLCTVNLMLSCAFPAFVFWGPQKIHFYNDACLPLLGDKHPQCLGQPASKVWADAWPIVGPQLQSVYDGGETIVRRRARVPISRDGVLQDTYWDYSYSPTFDLGGAIAGILVVCREISDELFALRRADESEERLTRILDMVSEGVVLLDTHLKVMGMNPASEGMTGWSSTEAIGLPLNEVLRISRERNRPAVGTLLEQVQERGNVDAGQFTVFDRRDEFECAVSIRGAALQDLEGHFSGAVVFLSKVCDA